MSDPLSVSFTTRAIRHVGPALNWWIRNRPDARDLLQAEVQRALTLISSHPHTGAQVPNTGIRGVRRIHLPRIRYFLYYRMAASGIQVLALGHSSGGSDPF